MDSSKLEDARRAQANPAAAAASAAASAAACAAACAAAAARAAPHPRSAARPVPAAPPRAALYRRGRAAAQGAGTRRPGRSLRRARSPATPRAAEPADSSAALRGGSGSGASHPSSLRAFPPGSLPSSPPVRRSLHARLPAAPRRSEAAAPSPLRSPLPPPLARGHSLKRRGGCLEENPTGKPPASREMRSGCPRAGGAPRGWSGPVPLFPPGSGRRGLRGVCAGLGGAPAPPAGPPRASRTGASVTNPVGFMFVHSALWEFTWFDFCC